MVELDSYSSGDRSDSGVDRDKAQALRSNTPEAILLPDIFAS
jgi:hypothetical protein